MARRPITRKLYDLMVEGFRESPGNASHAAKRAGCERRMAKRGWDEGWKTYSWARPIREVLREEQGKARAKVAADLEREEEVRRAERERATEESLKARVQMTDMLSLNRSSLLRTSGQVAHLTVAGVKIAEYLREKVVAQVEADTLDVGTGMKVLDKISLVVDRLTRAVQQHQKAENLHAGKPSEIIGIEDMSTELTLEEAEREAQAALQAIKSAKSGHLKVLDGGRSGVEWGGAGDGAKP